MGEFDENKIRRLDGGLLLLFRELLRSGRGSIAADRLGLSPSAVSHALARLRILFGDPLFTRRPHGLEPTRRALELAPTIEALVDLATAAISHDGGFDPRRSQRRFNLGAPEFVTALIGTRLIESLTREAPNVSIAIAYTAEGAAMDALRRGELDLALGRFGPARSGFVLEPFFEDVHCVIARRDHPTVTGPLDLQTYCDLGHVFAWSPSEGGTDEVLPDAKLVKELILVPQWLTALVLVASSDAIGSCPRRLAERHAEMMGLQVLPPPFKDNPIRVSAMRRSGVKEPAVDWLLDQVRKAAEA